MKPIKLLLMKLSNPFKKKPVPQEKSWANTDQGWMDTSWDAGWWQQNLQPLSGNGINEAVEACVSALAQTVASLPIYHFEEKDNGELDRKKGSNAERVLLRPNDYSTRSQFFNSLIRSMYYSADGYAVASRGGNRQINQLHIVEPKSMEPIMDPENGEVYYWGSPRFGKMYNPETDNAYPARDVLHLRINVDPKRPLKGQTPLTAATNSVSANSSIIGQQASFFKNMLRPSGYLKTEAMLNREQMKQLREAVDEQAKGMNSGGMPIFSNGLDYQSMSLSSQDSQVVEAFAMTKESISSVFRVPLPLINSMAGSTFNNAEALMRWFLASGLGFLLEHIELELNNLFGLPFGERLNFETKAMLRSDWKTQIDTLGEGVLKGIYSPNEARGMVGLPPAKDGDEPRVQQQVVPLSAWDMEPAAEEPVVVEEPVVEEEEDVEAALSAGIEKGFASAS